MNYPELKNLKSMVVSTYAYKERRLAADAELRKQIANAQTYNVTIRLEKESEAKEKHQKSLDNNKNIFEDSMTAAQIIINTFLASKFTMDLNEVDLATLDNLSKIEISPNEMKLQFIKYKDNPLALRRLEQISKNKTWGEEIHNTLVAGYATNVLGFDYYAEVFDEFIRTCNNTIREYDTLDPEIEMDEFIEIALNIQEKVLENELVRIDEILSSL